MNNTLDIKQKAHTLISSGQFEQARTLLLEIQSDAPDDPEIMLAIGIAYAQEGDFHHAEEWLNQTCNTDPDNAVVHFYLANTLRQLQKVDAAIDHYQMAIALQPSVFEVHFMLASTLMVQKQLEDAEYHFQYAIGLRPDNADCHANLGQVYELMHQLEDARSACDKALQLQPNHIGALLLLGKINSRESRYGEAEQLFRQVLAAATDDSLIAMTSIELGHALDKLGQFDNAYDAFVAGKSKWAQITANIYFDRQEYQKHIANNTKWFTQTSVENLAHSTTDTGKRPDPIFFVGFPRSGTTLTEQILNQHPDIVTSNESPILQQAIESHPGVIEHDSASYEHLLTANGEQLDRLRNTYWQVAKDSVPDLQSDSLLVDKLPLNLVHLGFISMLFPNARIITAIRDPRDVCLSCFMQGFTPNPAMVNFFTLDSSVDFYKQVIGLWLHYREVLPLKWHQYRYEDLVDDFDKTTQQLFDFLGLRYPKNIADFHVAAKKRLISTPSYQDVTTPVYHHSVGRWRDYEIYLRPHVKVLAPYLDEFGYTR